MIRLTLTSAGWATGVEAKPAVSAILDVESHEVVHIESRSSDGCLFFDACMGSMPIVVVEPDG